MGASVTLIDAWGPGNSRSSSGGESRVIRATYGPSAIYTKLAIDSLHQWKENQQRWQCKLLHQTGVLWMVGRADDSYERAALDAMRAEKFPCEELTTAQAAKRWPQIDFSAVRWCIFEPESGYLLARQACEAVVEAFVAEGGTYNNSAVTPGDIAGGEMRSLKLSDGSEASSGQFIFACGPWLPQLFPFLQEKVVPTRQEVFFFGTPSGDARFLGKQLPVWIDHGEQFYYGIPASANDANGGRGFKLANDTRGPAFEPTHGD